MKHLIGNDRNQIQFFSLEELIDQNNEVRLIDLFVNSLNLGELGFAEKNKDHSKGGRPAYTNATLLKLFIFGYLNRIRSSRQLEKESKRNIELMWLIQGLRPDHNTIANFRKDNPDAIRNVFKSTVAIAKNFNLIGGKILAGDGTKLRAQNSKKNNFNAAKLERNIEYINQKLDEYNQLLAQQDGDKNLTEKTEKRIKTYKKRKEKYKDFQKQLEEKQITQISTSDPESRLIMVRNNISEVAYNVQATVDEKNCLPIDYKVTNENDAKAMAEMIERSVDTLAHKDFTLLLDKGYHSGEEFKKAAELEVEVLVAIPDLSASSVAPHPDYNLSQFIYNEETDTFTCPEGNTMSTNGHWYKKSRDRKGKPKQKPMLLKQYKTAACKTCPVYELCTRAKDKRGRVIERNEYSAYLENNRRKMEQNPELYRKRQAIVEHPFGIIKRGWGFDHIMTKKTMKHASADVGLIFTSFNLKRLFNILSVKELKVYLSTLQFYFYSFLKHFEPIYNLRFFNSKIEAI